MSPEAVNHRLPVALLALRLGVFIVMFMWTLDKFVQPDHAAAVFESFYGLAGLGATAFFILGAFQMVLIVGFLLGIMPRLTYGLVFLFHGISTLSSYAQYMNPFENLLFFAAWPMLAACFALYLLRDADTLLSWNSLKGASA